MNVQIYTNYINFIKKVTKVIINISMISYISFFFFKSRTKIKVSRKEDFSSNKEKFFPRVSRKTREGGSWKIISRKKGRGSTNRSKRNMRGTRRQFVSRRTSPFCSLRRLSTTRGKLFVRVSRGGSRGVAKAACTDGHAQRRDAFIDQRPYARQRPFYFSADGFRENSTEALLPFETCEGEEERGMRTSLRSRVRPFTCSRRGKNL